MDFSPKMWSNIIPTIVGHYKAGEINWPMGIYVVLVHTLGLIGLSKLFSVKAETLLWSGILWPISALGITVGVHRLWSHRSYDAHWTVRVMLMLWNSIANQGSIYHWARDHRVHHKYAETTADPHDATRGFFFAHVGWLLVKKHPDIVKAGRELNFDDLKADPIVMFQKKYDPWFTLYMCFIFPAQVAQFGWGETFWNGFFVPGALRYIITLHITWMVNSAAHLYGDHPYDVLSFPGENPFVSFWAVGEGWHNWHHKYPYDYAASEFGISAQFNPSKLLIDTMAKLGLVTNRKRGTNAWALGKARRVRDEANGIAQPVRAPRSWEMPKEVLKTEITLDNGEVVQVRIIKKQPPVKNQLKAFVADAGEEEQRAQEQWTFAKNNIEKIVANAAKIVDRPITSKEAERISKSTYPGVLESLKNNGEIESIQLEKISWDTVSSLDSEDEDKEFQQENPLAQRLELQKIQNYANRSLHKRMTAPPVQ